LQANVVQEASANAIQHVRARQAAQKVANVIRAIVQTAVAKQKQIVVARNKRIETILLY
jgi:hypothetical protein